jgi:hypothetical protein
MTSRIVFLTELLDSTAASKPQRLQMQSISAVSTRWLGSSKGVPTARVCKFGIERRAWMSGGMQAGKAPAA